MIRFARISRTAHRWLAWIVGLQVVVWLATGLVMSLLSSERVKSEHLKNPTHRPALLADWELIPLPALIVDFGDRGVSVAAASLQTIADDVVYDVTATDGARLLVHARTGEILTPIDAAVAERIANMDRVSGGPAAATELLHEPDTEYRGATPVWRVSYDDEDSARVYISPITGEVIGRTNSMWRLHDFVWMLHIMDYDERRDYNNWILRAVAIMGGLFALTGVGVLSSTIRRRRLAMSSGSGVGPDQ